jgi:histidyl-tRNA synthetase
MLSPNSSQGRSVQPRLHREHVGRRRPALPHPAGVSGNGFVARDDTPVGSPVVSESTARHEPFKAPVGTHDVLPPESERWQALISMFSALVGRAGFGLVQSPMFEEIGVFARVGEGTDVVGKEMYDFRDKGDRHLALRPEGTASVARAYVQHRPTPPWKVWYAAPSFRYERPQAGRFRQHHQLGVEALGSSDPDLDVEIISMLWDFYASLGLSQVELVINSMGTAEDRRGYIDAIQVWLRDRLDRLDPADAEKIDAHPMRVLDSKRPITIAAIVDAPRITDHLSPDARTHFERVQAGLNALGIPFRIEPRLVRGLDYYTHTTFEFISHALEAAQSTIGGGGRYDGLVESLGGPPTPGIGFGTGIERVLLTCDAEGVFPAPDTRLDVYIIDTAGGHSARDLAVELRRSGISADRAYDQRSMKSQMKSADRSGAAYALIIGPDERDADGVIIRPLRDRRPQHAVERATVVPTLIQILSESIPMPEELP